jgi:hypothetical protein
MRLAALVFCIGILILVLLSTVFMNWGLHLR